MNNIIWSRYRTKLLINNKGSHIHHINTVLNLAGETDRYAFSLRFIDTKSAHQVYVFILIEQMSVIRKRTLILQQKTEWYSKDTNIYPELLRHSRNIPIGGIKNSYYILPYFGSVLYYVPDLEGCWPIFNDRLLIFSFGLVYVVCTNVMPF